MNVKVVGPEDAKTNQNVTAQSWNARPDSLQALSGACEGA